MLATSSAQLGFGKSSSSYRLHAYMFSDEVQSLTRFSQISSMYNSRTPSLNQTTCLKSLPAHWPTNKLTCPTISIQPSKRHSHVHVSLTAIATQHRLTYGLSLSPIRAALQNVPSGLESHVRLSLHLKYSRSALDIPMLISVQESREDAV